MDFNTTIDIILKDLSEVQKIVDDLKNYPGVPELQVELAKAKCKSAGEVIALLKTFKPDKSEAETHRQKAETELPVIKVPEESKHGLMELDEQEQLQEQAPANQAGEVKEEIKEKDDLQAFQQDNEPEPEIKNVPEPTAREIKDETAIIADRFSGRTDTILDKFGSMPKENDISSVIKTKPVDKLSDVIGLNDKFLFIREIFKGSRQSYDEAVARLDSAGSYPEALEILKNYSEKEEDDEVVKQLLDIVKRKLPS